MSFKTDYKDEIATNKTRQIIDVNTGAVIHEKVLIKNNYTPTQAGDRLTSTWVNEVGEHLNKQDAFMNDAIIQLKYQSNDNLLINPCFQIWQRGNHFPNAVNGDYTADRWRIFIEGTGENTVNIQPMNGHMVITGKNKARYVLHQFIELTPDLKKAISVYGKITVSAHLKISKDTDVEITAEVNNTIGRIIKAVKANTVSDIAFTTDINVDNTESRYLQINIVIPASSAQSTLTVYWAKVEMGSVVTPFMARPISSEMLLCQRYFINLGTVYFMQMASTVLTSQYYNAIDGGIPVPMMTTPVISYASLKRMDGSEINNVIPIFDGRISQTRGIKNFQLSSQLASNHNNSTLFLTFVTLDAEVR